MNQLAELYNATLRPEVVFRFRRGCDKAYVAAALRRQKNYVRVLLNRGVAQRGEGDKGVILCVYDERRLAY